MMTETKERPIIFNAEMVRAILAGRKTQTRRVIKPQPPHWTWNTFSFDERCVDVGFGENETPYFVICPYGKPGDRLWVRETWRPWSWHPNEPLYVQYKSDMTYAPANNTRSLTANRRDEMEDWELRQYEKIDVELKRNGYCPDEYGVYSFDDDPPLNWRPSIFMPRWASRILLEITNVRVERLQEITMQDAVAEGVSTMKGNPEPRVVFQLWWDEINAKRGYPWSSNPWVWVVVFKVLRALHDIT